MKIQIKYINTDEFLSELMKVLLKSDNSQLGYYWEPEVNGIQSLNGSSFHWISCKELGYHTCSFSFVDSHKSTPMNLFIDANKFMMMLFNHMKNFIGSYSIEGTF